MIAKIQSHHIANTLGIALEDAINLDVLLTNQYGINRPLSREEYLPYAQEAGINVPQPK